MKNEDETIRKRSANNEVAQARNSLTYKHCVIRPWTYGVLTMIFLIRVTYLCEKYHVDWYVWFSAKILW